MIMGTIDTHHICSVFDQGVNQIFVGGGLSGKGDHNTCIAISWLRTDNMIGVFFQYFLAAIE